jgi:molybdate transport system ATP-binding protein
MDTTMIAGASVLRVDCELQRGDFHLRATAEVPNGVTGLFGPSGCGKSTLLAVVAGLVRPRRGSLVFAGEVLFDAAAGIFVPAWQRHIALVFQEGQLFPHLTVRENLLYGYSRREPSARRYELADALDLLGIAALLGRRPTQLSGGERQRVALGRALLCSPRLLLLDEPLAALDEQLKDQILPYLVRLKREADLPMLYVTHSREELTAIADRVIPMQQGRFPAASVDGENHV